MGYQRSTLRLIFADPQFDGLEVRMKRMNVGTLNAASKLAEIQTEELTEEEGIAHVNNICERLAPNLLSWNYEDNEGNNIPSTMEGLQQTDLVMLMAILEAWMDASVNVPDFLDKKSNNGNGNKNGTLKMSAELDLAKLKMDVPLD